MDFSTIAARYEEYSSMQQSAGEVLLSLLAIGSRDDVLDLGCGVGHFTQRIRELTKGAVAGIDPSEGMIREARAQSRNLDITFDRLSAEEMDYKDRFDVIFCNSSFQWFRDPHKAITNCRTALRKGGRIGIQAPAKMLYSPNFIAAVRKVEEDPRTSGTFARFREPWFFLETADAYRQTFETAGFRVVFSRLETQKTRQTPDEVFKTFSSGAIAGYLNQECYDVSLSKNYRKHFLDIVKAAFNQQADVRGCVELIFKRMFLVAVKT